MSYSSALCGGAVSAPRSKLIHAFHRQNRCRCLPQFHSIKLGSNFPQNSLNFRLTNAARLQLRTRLFSVFASNSNSSDGDTIKDRSEVTISSNDSQGPPLLTILAGFLAFSLVVWVFGSIIMWLFGLIFKVPPSK